jgi:putative methionine-R-sulfoxide reductase with GAF domain
MAVIGSLPRQWQKQVKRNFCTANVPARVERVSSALQQLRNLNESSCAPSAAGLYILVGEVLIIGAYSGKPRGRQKKMSRRTMSRPRVERRVPHSKEWNG